LHNQALRRINLHEDRVRETLSEADRFQGSVAASSPLGEHGDWEVHAWQQSCQRHVHSMSPTEVRDLVAFSRHRLRRLLESVEKALGAPQSAAGNPDGLRAALEVAYSEFRRLRSSPVGWQDVQTGDGELVLESENVLRRLCRR
jgi:hypothetical protein